MNISLNRNFFLKDSTVTDIWSISPQKEILLSLDREVYPFIKLCILNEIPKHTKLFSFEENAFIIKSTYSIPQESPSISNISFRWIPFVGKKTCAKCIYYLKRNRSHYCVGRASKLKKDYWHNCLYWTERTVIKDFKKW